MRHAQVEQRQFKELVAKVRSRYQISMRESVEPLSFYPSFSLG